MTKGWQTKTLGEIADVKGGKRVPKGYKLQTEPTDHPYITVSDFTDDGTIDTSRLRYVSQEVFEQIKRYTISSKDLYLSIAGTIGKTGYVPDELDGANLTENACKLVLHPGTSRDFLYYFTKSSDFADQAGANTRTAAQPKLALERLKTIKLCIPPLPEQQRIVAILDDAFADLATAKTNAEKNLQNARALFESHLDAVFSQREAGWEETTLEKILNTQPRNGWSPPAANHSDTGTPVLTLSSVTGFQFRPEKIKYTSAPTDNHRHYWVNNGDFLITRSNTPELVGHVAIASGIEQPTIYPDLIMRMNPNPEEIMTEFLFYQLRTAKLRSEITSRAHGANPTMKKLNKEAVQTLPICVPTLPTQKSILNSLNRLADETGRLARIYEQKLTALGELKQSLLHQAFSGQL
ncbi:type I restriction enzyme, S subunit [Desulfomicrobium apsheronum]|uniref:Type I restriction enzyme, S subunit n=1 Tax=Desulfomicrobium apsheronum TaxID=52560 RepID=A0A1I3SAS2_9BACT|nr:restriction endonuclease subunit S [Desulfomicrobium apsheronum]SFJ54709.1 type I restriction enzyme, S subunit [Desulfomicrobium apsheronum]